MYKNSENTNRTFENKIWLSSPTMHGEEMKYVKDAYETNWMSTIGENIDVIEEEIADIVGCDHSVALSSGTSAIHLAVKLAGVKQGDKVFCSNLTFAATVNPIIYEGGEPIFIDSEYDTWNMDPKALEKAFVLYPEVKVVVMAHLYGVPGKIDEIRAICDKNHAILIEDAAESFGASYKGKETGSFGYFNAISFNGNKIITGTSGGMLLTNNKLAANKARKWATQSRENAAWYQHEELGYNYRMSNVIAGVVRGQFPFLKEHINQKRDIYERYCNGFKDLPILMNPFDKENSSPNFWLSCLTINSEAMAKQVRSDHQSLYDKIPNKTTPTEILEALSLHNVEGRPIWKPMHLQPLFRRNDFITESGSNREISSIYKREFVQRDVSSDLFNRGICLPSDNKMSVAEQKEIIEIVKNCFK